MPTTTTHGLAYETHGSGTAVLLLHGLTFDRTTWRPIVERLGDDLHTIAVDLPAHGESGGEPCRLDVLADRIRALVDELGVERPVVVGHSIGGALAGVYAASHPVLGTVSIDQGVAVREFAALVQRLEPALRGEDFAAAFAPIQRSIALDRLPEPMLALVRDAQRIRQDVVLGYWDELLTTDPDELQARIDAQLAQVDAPGLAIFGGPVTDGDRERYARLPNAEVEEWTGDGHLLHLVEPDRFATRLRVFVERAR